MGQHLLNQGPTVGTPLDVGQDGPAAVVAGLQQFPDPRLRDNGVEAGTRAWLASQLSDWGAADDDLLSEALTAMATRFVDEDADRRLEPAASS